MSEIKAPPKSFSWHPDIDATTLANQVNSPHDRLLSLKSYVKNGARKLAAIWIKEDNPGWSWKPDITPAHLKTTLQTADARLVTLDAFDDKGVHCAAAWIPKNGVFSDWSAQIDAPTLKSRLAKEDGQLTCLRSYLLDGRRTFSAIWVKKTTEWDWDPAIDFAALNKKLDDGAQRLVSIDSYVDNGALKFAAVWVADAGFTWWWNAGLSEPVEKAQYQHFCSYPIDLVPYDVPAGTLVSVMYAYPVPAVQSVNILQASGSLQIQSIADFGGENSTGTLTLKNLTNQTIDASQTTCYELSTGGTLANSYPAFGSSWIFGSQSSQIPPLGSISSAITPAPDICTSDLMIELVASSGSESQLSRTSIPFTRSGFPAAPIPATPTTPVILGVWTNPVEVIPLWNGKQTKWLTLAGNLIKRGNDPMLITHLHLDYVVKGGSKLIDQDLDLSKFVFFDTTQNKLVPAAMTNLAAQTQGANPLFLYGIPQSVEFPDGEMSLEVNYNLNGKCGSAAIKIPVRTITPVTLHPPVSGTWSFGNSPNHTGFDSHASVHQRYSVDLTIQDPVTGSTLVSPGAPPLDNTSYRCWGKPIHCMADGTVRSVTDNVADNNGNQGNVHNNPPNYVLVDHGGGQTSGYFHMQKGSVVVSPGAPIHKGDLIAKVGNAGGTSEPHLHLEYRTDADAVGLANHLPMQFKSLFVSQGGAAVVGVPATGLYFAVV